MYIFCDMRKTDDMQAITSNVYFAQGFSQIYLLIANSERNADYLKQIEEMKPNFRSTMNWLAAHARTMAAQDVEQANQLFLNAIPFILGGKILNDPALTSLGYQFIKMGVSTQRPDGSFNEHGGADTSYQWTSILNIGILLMYFVVVS